MSRGGDRYAAAQGSRRAKQTGRRLAVQQAVCAILASPDWTLSRLAARLGVQTSTVSRWRDGGMASNAHTLEHLQRIQSDLTVPDDAVFAALDRRWRRTFEAMRQQRDWALMLVCEFRERLERCERRLELSSARVEPLDRLVRMRVREADDRLVVGA